MTGRAQFAYRPPGGAPIHHHGAERYGCFSRRALEEVEPKRSLFGPDYLRLAALVLVAVAVHAWLVSHTALTARDSLGFARQGAVLRHPIRAPHEEGHPKNTIDHIRAGEHPPGYPLTIWGVYTFVGLVSDAPVADRALLARNSRTSSPGFCS